MTEEQVAAMSDTELLAFVRSSGSFKEGKANFGRKGKNGRKGVWKGDRKGGGWKGEPPPRDRYDLRCINCGGKVIRKEIAVKKSCRRTRDPASIAASPVISRATASSRVQPCSMGGQTGSNRAGISISTATLRLEFVRQRPKISRTHAGRNVLRSLTLMDSGQ